MVPCTKILRLQSDCRTRKRLQCGAVDCAYTNYRAIVLARIMIFIVHRHPTSRTSRTKIEYAFHQTPLLRAIKNLGMRLVKGRFKFDQLLSHNVYQSSLSNDRWDKARNNQLPSPNIGMMPLLYSPHPIGFTIVLLLTVFDSLKAVCDDRTRPIM